MSLTITIQNEAGHTIQAGRLQRAAITVLEQHQVAAGSEMTVVITSNEKVQALNKQFRQVDAPTDVLSFTADIPPVPVEEEPPYLGDLVIAYPYAKNQAKQAGHDLHDSLDLLVVHGALHLLGYDHDTPENRREMWQAQEQALKSLGLSMDLVPALEESDHADS